MKTLFTIGEVAKMLSKPRYMISYLFEQSILEETNRVGNKRVFTKQDINKIQDYFERRSEKQSIKNNTELQLLSQQKNFKKEKVDDSN